MNLVANEEVQAEQPQALTPIERPMMFDWSEKRKKGIIGGSQKILEKFLKERVPSEDLHKITDLWANVIGVFQASPDSTQLLHINNELIAHFEASELPTHSEYHIAKVVTLTTELFEKVLPAESQTSENALALSISAIMHDLGSLQKVGEPGPQEKFYKDHELRALALVDPIVDALQLTDYVDPTKNQVLKNKIKILIASTIPAWNLNFSQGPQIVNLIKPGDSPVSKDKFMHDLDLVDGEEPGLVAAGESLFQLFQSLLEPDSLINQDEILKLSQVMGAADHGAYMLEPCRIGEIIGLWQELNRMWISPDGKLTHRPLPPNINNYLQYLTSKFAKTQWTTYEETLGAIVNNPFVEGGNIPILEMKIYADRIGQLLSEQSDFDSLFRFEGAFSPIQLVALAEEMGLGNQSNITDEIEKFSKSFAHPLTRVHSFNALATPVLKLMYKETPLKRSLLLQKAMTTILDEVSHELTNEGKLNLHIAPIAYTGETGELIDDFIGHFERAYDGLNDKDRQRIKTVYLTVREDQKDDIKLFRQIVRKHNFANKKPPLAISIAGIPSGMSIANLIDEEKDEEYPLHIHFGLEKLDGEDMSTRLEQLMSKLSKPDNKKLFDRVSIHLDDRFREFMDFYNSHPEYQSDLVELRKSIAPLDYLMIKGDEGFATMEEFYAIFKKFEIASNNPSMLGDISIAGQRLALQ